MAFEVYVPRAANDNAVTLTKHHIRIGNKLLGRLKGDKLEVAYDVETNKIRIKGTDGPGLTVAKNKVGARGIFTYFNLDLKGRYEADFDEKQKAIYVDLNKRR